ncbi:hypothetical protein [Haloarchaeobius sp. HRN-SO-5]|uniref:hypothetical protein n=1 Tax=Haloarchaeobius sp. HRN-SO-5 TaxID=3446118 RepID=UPI003EB9DC2F
MDQSSHTRRQALGRIASAGIGSLSVLGLAGCLQSDRDATLTVGDGRRADSGRVVKVRDVGVQTTLFHAANGYSGIVGLEGTQFLVLAGVLGDAEFRLDLDDERYGQVTTIEGIDTGRTMYDGQRMGFDQNASYRVIPLPTDVSPQEGSIVVPQDDGRDLRWRLPADARAAIANPPTFEVRDVAVEEVTEDGRIPLSFSVTRTGGRREPFRFAIESDTVAGRDETLSTPGGETVSWDAALGFDADASRPRFVLDWGFGQTAIDVPA